MTLYRAVCTSRDHNPPGVWVYPTDGGVDYKTADNLATQHVVVDYPHGDHDARVEEYIPPPQPKPAPQPQPPAPETFCKGEYNATVGAAAALIAAYAAAVPACAGPQAIFACPIAIGAVVAAQVQLIGSQQQYEKCLREHQQHAQADALQGAMESIAAEVSQLQELSKQMQAMSGTA